MKNISKNPLFYLSIILTITAGFMVFNFVSAQTYEGPTTSFPEGNTATPIPSTVLSSGSLNFTGSGRTVMNLGSGHSISGVLRSIANTSGDQAAFGTGLNVIGFATNGWGQSSAISFNAYHNDTGNNDVSDHMYYRAGPGGHDAGAALISTYLNGGGKIHFRVAPASTGAGDKVNWTRVLSLDGLSANFHNTGLTNVSSINGIDADDLGGAAESCDADSICEGNMF
ncbi:MAG: hypothetical protein WD607_10330, partial [Candidatus Paceibacterota bacterium]